MNQVDQGDPRWVMAFWISQKCQKDADSQQFLRIFKVKYLSNDSSNQYGSKVILD